MSIVVHSSANKAKDKKANKKPDVVFNEEKIEDVKYLKKYFKDIDWNITHDRSDPTTELAQLNEHLTTVLENRGTAFSFMFLNEALPRVVSTLLERSYPEPEWQEEALTFVRRVVESIVNCINDKSHSDDLLGTLEPIFTKTGDFYRHNGAKDEVAAEHKASFLPPAEGDARPDGRWGKIEELDTYTSIYYARMIDYFGEIGGFDAILNRIQDTEDRLPSGTMLLMCKFLEFVKNDVIAQFWTEYVAAMGAALKNYFNTMEDSDMREAKLEDLEDAVHVLVLISNKIRDTATADDLEIFKLDMALKYVQLPYIEPIIKGIEQISHMIQVAQGKVSPTTTARAQKRAKRYKGSRYGGYGPYTASYTRARSAGTSTSSGAGTSVGAQAAAAAASRAIVVVDDNYDNSSSGCASYEDWMAAKAAEVTDALAANTAANAGAGSGGGDDGDAKKPDVPAKPRTVVTTEFMLNWLQENDMISVVLSLDHPEAIRKGSEILIFLAKETELDTETINTMWAASKVHESQQKVVFELFTKLLATLPIEMIDFIYDKVEEIPVTAYNQQVLTFIADFTSKGLEERSTRNLEPRSYGLDIFFGLVINGAGPDGTPVDPNTTNEACTLVQAILKKFPDQREAFVAKVVDGLGGGDIASVSLKLLSDVVRSYPSKEINATVVGLEEKYQLVNAVLTDLANCKAAANEAAAEAATESVKARLAFLEFILTESELSITADQADSLWDSLTSIGQSDVAYEWLTDVQYSHLDIDPYLPKSSKFPAFSDEVVEHLFLNKMNTIDAAGFTTTGLTMYSRYFVTVNSQQRFLRRLGIDEFQARSVDLVGLGFFRDVALDCNDEATATASRVLLENAFDGSSKRIAPAVRAWRVAATRDLMAVLESSKGDETKLRRAVTLLTNLVRKDAKAKAKAAAGEATPGSVLTNEYFDTMFAMLSDPELGRRVWELLMLCPTHEATRANVSSLETSGEGEGFAKLSFAQNLSDPDAPEYIFQLLYLVQVIHGLLLSDETWRGAFIAADGVAFLAHIFQTQDFLNPKHGQYGRMVASYLVETLRILREADQAATTAAFSPGFVHHVLDQISVLASQPILKVAIDDAADEEAAMAADEAKEAKAAASKKRGTRIADCHYSSNKSVLKFDVTGNRYRVSAYVVDYNTFKRTQHLKAWLGEDEPDDLPKKQWLRGNKASAAAAAAAVESDSDDDEGDEGAGTGGDGAEAGEGGEAAAPAEPEAKPDLPPIIEVSGRPFHNGQWLSWDVDGEGVFNITIDNTTGPNWVLSAVMIDRYGGGDDHLHDGAEVTAHPRFVGIDSTTKGKWIGTYGEFGGVQLGIKDNLVPVRPGSGPNAPRLAEYDTGRVEKYEWIKRLTTDNRGMQQAPHPDQMDFFSSDDEGEEASGDAGASAGGASASDGPAGSSGAGDAAASAGDGNDDDDDDKEVELPETSSAILNLLFSSASSSNEIMGAFLGYPSLPTWIFDSIVKCQDSDLRSGIVTGLIEITGSHPDSAAQLLDGLLPFVSQLADHRETAVSFDAYFSLLSSLLEAGGQYDAGALLDQLTDLLRDHPIVESEDEPDVVDTELIGILKVLTQLLVSNPDLNDRAADPEGGNLVNEVFGPCLFDAPESRLAADVPKCKSDAARDAGFVLLAHLASMVPAAQLALADKLSGHLQTVPLPTGWAIDVTKAKGKKGVSRGSETGWTGLKNQGCTCYMNATLQQLFVLPGLRRDILNVPQPASIQAALAATPSAAAAKKDFDAKKDDDGKKEGGEEKKEGGEAEADAAAAAEDLLVSDPKQNTMYQLQKLFALMTQAKSSWVDTIDFCKTVRLGGEVINVRRQEDANEFFNTLADSLEPYLAGTPQETMFRDSFGGSFLHQIISEDCIHSSERAEDFLTVSIKVQNKRNVDESLKFLIEADRLDGNNKYKCDQCDDHVVARKRQVIQHLPNTLILHLKRFEFSFETFQNVKVYDRFEFPETLNMKAFTKEGLAEAEGTPLDPDEVRPDDYYEYELKGVLIHSGTANSGHYYSYIQERNEDGEEARWFEFNDRRVSPFNTRDIDDQCFGGNYSQKSKHPKSHSAYMLFYDRKTKYPARTYDIAPAAETPAVTDGSDNAAAADEGGAEVSSGILDTIWQQGVNNARQRQLMSMACFEFMWRCVTVGAAEDPVMEWRPLTEAEEESRFVASVKLATKIVMDIMSHCVDNVQIAEKFATLQSLYERHLPLSHWLFGELASAKSNWTLNILLNCPDKSIRNAAVSLVQHLFESAYAIERPTYAHAEDEQPSAFMVMFIYKVITLLHAAASKPTHRIQQLLAVLLAFARIGTPERAVLLERNAVADLIALFTAQKTPLIMRQTPYKFRNLLETLAELVCGADNPHHLEHQGEEGVPEATGLELKAMAHSKTFDRRFLNSVIQTATDVSPVVRIIEHWAWGDQPVSNIIIGIAISGADTNVSASSRKVYYHILARLCALNDPEREWRLATMFKLIFDKIRVNIRLPHFRNAFSTFVLDMAEAHPDVAALAQASEVFATLVQTRTEMQTWLRLKHHDRFCALFPDWAAHIQPKAKPAADGSDEDDGGDEDGGDDATADAPGNGTGGSVSDNEAGDPSESVAAALADDGANSA